MKKRIILVGSSSKVLDRKHGEFIDKFEHVVRFNSYKIEGYEDYVGSKEKIWASNLGLTQHKKTAEKYLKSNDYIWYVGSNPVTEFKIEKSLLALKQVLSKQYVVESLNFGVENFINEIKHNFTDEALCFERGKIRVGKDQKYATTGLRAILKAIERFGLVYTHGFTFYQECNRNLKNSHYYPIDNVPEHMRKAFTEDPNTEHDVDNEFLVFRKLMNMGLVRPLTK